MEAELIYQILWGVGGAALGGVIFAAVGLISGTSETATIAPAVLLVVLLGFPPEAAFTFCIASVVSKHIIHAAPTALLGIPGDTMAVPMLEPCAIMRRLGAPHVALQKMVSAGVLSSLIAIPISVGFATLLAPFGDIVKVWAGAIFTVVAIGIAYASTGRWASLFMLIPFAFVIQALDGMAKAATGKGVVICFFLGIAIGPMFGDLITALSPIARSRLVRKTPNELWLAPDLKSWTGMVPNPLKILSAKQKLYMLIAAFLSALTFTFSPVGMTILAGEVVKPRVKSLYEKTTTSLAVMNGTTESTYLAEIIIPLVAFGIPLSPIAMGVGFALFEAPPVYSVNPMHNVHSMMSPLEFFFYGLIAVLIAAAISYPIAMNYAHKASAWVMRKISQESILTMFSGLIVVLAYYEAGWVGVIISVIIGSLGGILNKYFGINIGVQFMTFYAAPWIVSHLFGFK